MLRGLADASKADHPVVPQCCWVEMLNRPEFTGECDGAWLGIPMGPWRNGFGCQDSAMKIDSVTSSFADQDP